MIYYELHGGGGFGYTDGLLPDGTRKITEKAYKAGIGEITEARAAPARAAAESAYDELVAVGLSPQAAARLSGHTPDQGG